MSMNPEQDVAARVVIHRVPVLPGGPPIWCHGAEVARLEAERDTLKALIAEMLPDFFLEFHGTSHEDLIERAGEAAGLDPQTNYREPLA